MYTFSGCLSITEVTIPSSVTNISTEAFAKCTSLQKVTFQEPSSVTSIDGGAFKYNKSEQSLKFYIFLNQRIEFFIFFLLFSIFGKKSNYYFYQLISKHKNFKYIEINK